MKSFLQSAGTWLMAVRALPLVCLSPVALGHEGHGLDHVPHDLLHVGWLLLVPFVVFVWRKRRGSQSRRNKS